MKRAYDVCAALTAVNGVICLVERAYVFATLAEFRCTKQPLQLAKNNTSSEDKEKQNMEREER